MTYAKEVFDVRDMGLEYARDEDLGDYGNIPLQRRCWAASKVVNWRHGTSFAYKRCRMQAKEGYDFCPIHGGPKFGPSTRAQEARMMLKQKKSVLTKISNFLRPWSKNAESQS